MGIHPFSAAAAAAVPLFLFILRLSAAGDPALPPAEKEAAYLALESMNPTLPWRSLYPDDLCLSGPHGLVCDLFLSAATGGGDNSSATDDVLHVTELNFGYVSDFASNPPCGGAAPTLPPLLPFPHLRKLFLYRCFTSAAASSPLPTDLWSPPPSLEELVLIDNPSLTGHLTSHISALPNLRRLILTGSAVSGAIPAEITRLRLLQQLVLSNNRLRGTIPLNNFSSGLKILDLSGNHLTGDIPAAIGHLPDLVKLDLSSNRISGTIPADIAGLRRLELLDLSSNRLTGGLPVALAELSLLRELHLSGNPRLGGRIPEIWEKLGGITALGLSGVGLVGEIPASMGVFLGNISYLALDHNDLQGELPEDLRRLERTAGEVNLAGNALSGRVPFSAAFALRMGGKLKLGGNPKLCLGEDLVGPGGGFGSLPRCNKTEMPLPVLVANGVLPVVPVLLLPFWMVFVVLAAH